MICAPTGCENYPITSDASPAAAGAVAFAMPSSAPVRCAAFRPWPFPERPEGRTTNAAPVSQIFFIASEKRLDPVAAPCAHWLPSCPAAPPQASNRAAPLIPRLAAAFAPSAATIPASAASVFSQTAPVPAWAAWRFALAAPRPAWAASVFPQAALRPALAAWRPA